MYILNGVYFEYLIIHPLNFHFKVVTNREDIQGYAAKTVFEALKAPACHENMVKVKWTIFLIRYRKWILGWWLYSRRIWKSHCRWLSFCSKCSVWTTSKSLSFMVLWSFIRIVFHFLFSTGQTRALILSAYIKMINL